MKKILQIGFLVVGVLWAFGVTGNAQVSRQYTVHVPFDFSVGNKQMKSGDYWIGPLSGVTNQRTVIIQSRSTGKIGVVGQAAITSTESDKAGGMTFAKYSDQWVLEELTTPGFALKFRDIRANERNVALTRKAAETKTVVIGR